MCTKTRPWRLWMPTRSSKLFFWESGPTDISKLVALTADPHGLIDGEAELFNISVDVSAHHFVLLSSTFRMIYDRPFPISTIKFWQL